VVAAGGGSVDVDAETAGLIAYAGACFINSDGTFDITSGLLRSVWDFSSPRLPDQRSIEVALPLIGFKKLALSNGQLAHDSYIKAINRRIGWSC
jgi:thiamine biosynthesis lipoprotein